MAETSAGGVSEMPPFSAVSAVSGARDTWVSRVLSPWGSFDVK